MLPAVSAVFMARKSSSAISDDEFEGALAEPARRSRLVEDSPLDARLMDLDDEAESSPFLRGQKRVPVKRGPLPLPRSTAGRLKLAFIAVVALAGIVAIAVTLQQYAVHSWRFRLDSSDNITISGTSNVSRAQVMDIMASDLDRNVFFVPLELRKQQLEQIPWVQSASVMRLLPDRLKVAITERTPIAFVQLDSQIELIDANGVIMDLPARQASKYSFPVVVGMTDADPLSTRAARMKIYARLIKDLDADGAHYSANISDIDVTDPDDVRATVTDPQGAVLVHLGSANFQERFKLYVSHVQDWRTQFKKLESVDLRYDHQVIVNPESAGVQAHNADPGPVNAAPETSVTDKQQPKKGPAVKHKRHK